MYPNSSLVYKLTPAIGVFGTGASLVEPPSGTYSTGYVPGQSFPAQHENWFMNYLSSDDIMTQNAYTNTLEELNTVLSNAGITPSSGATNQLYTAFTNGSLNLNLLGATLGADQLSLNYALATGTDLNTVTNTGFYSVVNPVNGPPGSATSTCFLTVSNVSGGVYKKHSIDVMGASGAYTRWERGYNTSWGTWTTNAIVTPGSSLGAGWSTDLAQDVSFQNLGFSGTAGYWMTLFESTDLNNAFGGCLLELNMANSPTFVSGLFALSFPGGGLSFGPIVSQLSGGVQGGPSSVAISWDGTRYYISVYVTATQASSGISARLIPLSNVSSYYWKKVVTQSAALPGTTGNVQQAITTTGTAPAPMTGQTNYQINAGSITLPACNLYETRFASGVYNAGGTGYDYLYLPAGGTYQYLIYDSTLFWNTAETAGGAQISSSAGTSPVKYIVTYRRIA